jgi:hypothetical protein
VRPFGFWGDIAKRALSSGKPANAPLNAWYALINVAVGIVATYSLYMSPVYLMGKWYIETAACVGIFLVCSAVLYFTWFKQLPQE